MLGLREKEFTLKIRVRTTLTNEELSNRVSRALQKAVFDSDQSTVSLDITYNPKLLFNGWATLVALWRSIWKRS